MSVMTIPDAWSGQERTLSVEDMENMPDDEFRYELDDGMLIVSPAPSRLHQLAVTRLAVTLSAACPRDLLRRNPARAGSGSRLPQDPALR